MTRSRSQSLGWRRGWIAPVGELPLTMEAWLPEPEMLDGTGVVTLEEVRDIACLMLLGEPGSGKSHVLRQEAEEIRQHAAGEAVLCVDLGLPQNARELREFVFDDEVVQRCHAGSGRLHLHRAARPGTAPATRAGGGRSRGR